MLLLEIYTVGFCKCTTDFFSKSISYSLFIPPCTEAVPFAERLQRHTTHYKLSFKMAAPDALPFAKRVKATLYSMQPFQG
jgi:hypothetical protein